MMMIFEIIIHIIIHFFSASACCVYMGMSEGSKFGDISCAISQPHTTSDSNASFYQREKYGEKKLK